VAGVVRLQRQRAAHVRQARRRHREARDAEPDEHEREQRVARGLAADADRPRQRAPASTVATTRRRSAGCQGRSASSPARRSAASAYCARSFVPMLAKRAGEDLPRAERGGGHLNYGDEFARRGVSGPVAL